MILAHWTFDPLVVICVLVSLVHARGVVRRRAAICSSGRAWRPWGYQALIFQAGLLLLVLALASPVEYWAERYLWVHMVQHVLLGLLAPPLLVIGAPLVPLLRGLPKPMRRRAGRVLGWGRRAGGRAALWRRLLAAPLPWVVLFNLNMVFWHLPGPYDLTIRDTAIRFYLEHLSFVVLGLAFWMQICGSYPFRPALHPRTRAGVEVATNAVMWVVAMALVLFSHDLYSVYAGLPHQVLSQQADQQIGGGILWICGEFSLVPSGYVNVITWLREELTTPDFTLQQLMSQRRWSAIGTGPGAQPRPSEPAPGSSVEAHRE